VKRVEGGFDAALDDFFATAGGLLTLSTRSTLNLLLILRASILVFTLKVSRKLCSDV
jgi:hypothetical protein